MYTKHGQIVPTSPFDFARSLHFLGFFKPMQGQQTTTAQSLTKAVFVEGQLLAFQLTSTGTIEQPRLEYILFSEDTISEHVEYATLDRIRFFLSLDDDLYPFYQIGLEDSHFVPLIHEMYGYHQVKFLTPFENACWAILTQRNPQNIAQEMKQRLTETYGGNIVVNDKTYWAFPEAVRLSDVIQSELLAVVRNARKVDYLLATIKAFTSVDEHFLRTGNYQAVSAWLRSIKGFGEWSTTFVLVRGLGRMEQMPVEKVLQEAASRLYGHELTLQELATLGEKYGSYKGYWAHYIRVGS